MGRNYLSIPQLQRCNRWSLGMDKYFHPTYHRACDYLSMLGLKLNHVSKRGPWTSQNSKTQRQCNHSGLIHSYSARPQWIKPMAKRSEYNAKVSKCQTPCDFVIQFNIMIKPEKWVIDQSCPGKQHSYVTLIGNVDRAVFFTKLHIKTLKFCLLFLS